MNAGFKLVIGSAVAIALMVVAVMLWTRNLIVFSAPLGVASVAAGWATFDNQFATLELNGRQAKMKIEKTVPGDWRNPKIDITLERDLT